MARKDYQIGVNITGSGVDDPDQQFFENYACGSERNYTGYCNPELEKQFVEQSTIADRDKRRRLVWEIDKKLQEDGARPIIYHTRLVTCMQPQLKGLTIMVNSQFNGWRMEDVWLDPLSWGCYGRLVTATCRRGDSERPVLELERTLSLRVREQNETSAASRSFLQCDRSRAR